MLNIDNTKLLFFSFYMKYYFFNSNAMTAMTPIIMVCAWNIVLSAIIKQKTQSYMLFSLMRIVNFHLKEKHFSDYAVLTHSYMDI